MLTSLTLDLTGLVVTTLDSSGKVTISWDHNHSDISLGSSGNHVFNEISVSWSIDDGVVPFLGEELLGSDGDRHTTLTLFLLAIHIESKSEGGLSETISLSLQLFQLTLWDTTQSEEQVSGGGGLTGIDVTADHDRQ